MLGRVKAGIYAAKEGEILVTNSEESVSKVTF